MQFKKILAFTCLNLLGMSAYANEVKLSANQPVLITYRIAHKNLGSEPIFGGIQSIELTKTAAIPIPLGEYERAGLVILSANGHELPQNANQFDKPAQCSMTTDKMRPNGSLTFNVNSHEFRCRTDGGVFG